MALWTRDTVGDVSKRKKNALKEPMVEEQLSDAIMMSGGRLG
jgi:hypothetical protein